MFAFLLSELSPLLDILFKDEPRLDDDDDGRDEGVAKELAGEAFDEEGVFKSVVSVMLLSLPGVFARCCPEGVVAEGVAEGDFHSKVDAKIIAIAAITSSEY